MWGQARKFSLGICIATALGLLGAPAALATPGTTLSAYVDTSAILHLNGTNTSTAGESFSNALVRLNNGTATGCTPSADCSAGGQFAQFDFTPPIAPGGTFASTINTVPAPYSGTIDVKMFVNGGGEVDVFGLQVQPLAVSSPTADEISLPKKLVVGNGPAALTAKIGHSATLTFDGTLLIASAGSRQRSLAALAKARKLMRIGRLLSTQIAPGQTSVKIPLRLTARGRRALSAAGKLKAIVRGTLSNSAGNTPITAKLTLIEKK